eukprot:Amastigsp_a6040_6.p5 type:complete len:146 gc:universal Amastigsp_a6040_6:519-956(+)
MLSASRSATRRAGSPFGCSPQSPFSLSQFSSSSTATSARHKTARSTTASTTSLPFISLCSLSPSSPLRSRGCPQASSTQSQTSMTSPTRSVHRSRICSHTCATQTLRSASTASVSSPPSPRGSCSLALGPREGSFASARSDSGFE